MKGGRSNAWVRRVLAGGLVVVLAYLALVVAADGERVLQALARMPARMVAGALALVAAAFLLRGLRWRLYLLRMGLLDGRRGGGLGLGASVAMGVASGKWGQLVKAHYLERIAGVPYSASLPAVFADRVSDVVALALLLAVGLALAPGGDWRAAMGAGVLLMLGVLALRSPRVGRALVGAACRLRRVRRHREGLERGLSDLRDHLAPGRLAPPSVVGLSAFLLEALALHHLAVGLGLPVGVGAAVLILGTADVAGMLSFMPGGLVAVEGSLVGLLVLQGVALPDAAALTLVFRAATLWWGMGLGMLGVGLLQARAWRARRGVGDEAGARSRSI